MSFAFLKSKKILIMITVAILVLAPSSYAGATYYQSNKLVSQADKLVSAGDYSGAIFKYDMAQTKWKWNADKITAKKNIAQKYNNSNTYLTRMTANFGKGEWQKCMDYLSKVDKTFPKYSQAKNRYSDCQKKLEEQKAAEAAAKKAEADRLAAQVTVTGTVQNYVSEKPIPNIELTLGNLTVKTGTKGEFGFTVASAGKITISFNKDGYLPFSGKYTLSKKSTNIGNIKLVPAGVVVFDDNRDNTSQKIYVSNYDGSGLKVLVPPAAGTSDRYPVLSPDGKKVVFQRNIGTGAEAHIYIVDSDGKNLLMIDNTQRSGFDYWTHDSKRVIWSNYPTNKSEVYSYDVATKKNTQIASSVVDSVSYTYPSDNSQKIAYLSRVYALSKFEVCVANIDGSGEVELFADSHFDRFYGFTDNKIYYETFPVGGKKYMVYDLVSKTNTEMQYNELIHAGKHKSPDGKYLAYVINPDDRQNLKHVGPYYMFISDINGGNEKKISSISMINSFDSSPIWSADSKLLVFYYASKLYVVSVDGGTTKKITDLKAPSSSGA